MERKRSLEKWDRRVCGKLVVQVLLNQSSSLYHRRHLPYLKNSSPQPLLFAFIANYKNFIKVPEESCVEIGLITGTDGETERVLQESDNPLSYPPHPSF